MHDEKSAARLPDTAEETACADALNIVDLIDNMPCLTFSKDAETGVYLACNRPFAEYAGGKSPADVVGLTDAQLFDAATAEKFVKDDRTVLEMDVPYFFFEDVPDAGGKPRQFQTTKLKFTDRTGRLCTLGMCVDVTEIVRVREENTRTKEAYEKARSLSIIYSHVVQTLARGYAYLYYVNLENGEFVRYRIDEGQAALRETQRGPHFFDDCRRFAEEFVYPDDRAAFTKALDRKALIAALDRDKTFFMTYRRRKEKGVSYYSMKVTRMEDDADRVIIGVWNIDEQVGQRRAAERAEEERATYARITALTGDFLFIASVDPVTMRYREYNSTPGFEVLSLQSEGEDFFGNARAKGRATVYPDDMERYLAQFTRENVMAEIERNGIFAMRYRLDLGSGPIYVQNKAAMVEEKDGPRLIVGVVNVDAHVRQEQSYERRLAQAQSRANVDALTGVKNKYAYQDAEEELDLRIREKRSPQFAIVILDVNNLKRINDTEGHQAGDQYLRDACSVVCQIFKRSPVYRVGGDEFAVIAQGSDYDCIEELLGRVRDYNAKAIGDRRVVIACGMARFEDDDCVSDVFQRADRWMYENKAALKAGKSH